MQEKVKQLRVSIDGIAQLTRELKPIVYDKNMVDGVCHSYETRNAYDSLILAKAWLGKVMGELGVESPYKSGYKTKEDIEPTADVANHNDKVSNHYHLPYSNMNHIEKVDWLRTCIEDDIKIIQGLGLPIPGETTFTTTREFAIARTNAYNHLCEARFHLGFELQRIKEA